MPHSYKMGDFDLTVESIVLVHRCTFAYGINTSDYREGRGVAGLVLCLSGKGRYVFEDACGKSEQLLAPGQMLFLPTDSRYVVTSAGKEPFCHITANFTLSKTHAEPDTAFDAILHNRLHYMSDAKTPPRLRSFSNGCLRFGRTKRMDMRCLRGRFCMKRCTSILPTRFAPPAPATITARFSRQKTI